MTEIKTDKVVSSCGATSSPCPDVVQIPWRALRILGERFQEGAVKHGRDNWRKGIGNTPYILERINHIVRHAMWLAEQLQGRQPDDCEDGMEGNVGAILWGGAFLAEAVAPLVEEKVAYGHVEGAAVCMADWGPGEKEAWDALTPKEQQEQTKKNLEGLLFQSEESSITNTAQDGPYPATEDLRTKLSKLFPNLF